MSTGDAELDAKLNNPPDSSIPKLREVFVGLVKNLQARWYEIFLNLGIHRNVLDKCLENHPFDDHSALIEMIAVWLQRSDPLPSWRCLVDVIQNTLLEGKVALEIKRKYCRELLQESEVEKEEDNHDESQPYIDNESVAFSKLLSNITEKLGPSCVPEIQHFLLNIRCPDGTPLFNDETLYDRKTIDGLLIPLVTSNFCTPRDLDILIHILHGLKRQDLLPLISAYVPNVTVGKPFVRPCGNAMFVIRVILNEALKRIDLGIVSAIKHDLCTCFGIQQRPFLIQYVGWQCTPIILHFQVPNACMQLVEEGLHNSVCELSGNGIDCIKLDISSTTFSIPTS